MTKFAIETDNLHKSFGDVNVLKGLDLRVEENSIYGFLGPNGAGKTTTIKLILGLLRPTSGQIRVFGKDFLSDGIAIKRQLGYLPQQPQFYDYLTAREILDYTMKFYFDGPQEEIDNRIELLLDIVSISKKADRPIKGFSGGEKRRLGIAQSMINFPKLLILDEPAAALDPIGRKDVLNIMEDLREYTTIFYSTHILDDVQKVSDNVAILHNGNLIAEGNIETLLAGTDGTIYDLHFIGDAQAAKNRLSTQEWIGEINPYADGDGINWLVQVTDETKAEGKLLRLLLEDPDLNVTRFQKKKFELEDVFMQVVEERK